MIYLSEIKLFPLPFPPYGWAHCNGQKLSIAEHHPLFSLIGNRYGGDGEVDFALPKLSPPSDQPELHYCICLMGEFPPRP